MKLDKLVGERFRERPAGCVIESHALMVRGGYMKGIANGIFSQYPPLRRVTRKLEQIIRERWMRLKDRRCPCLWCCPARCGRNRADM
jgi:prolyl-tRNA synthetase